MAIVFKDENIEPVKIVKGEGEGSPTTFFFRVTPDLRRQVNLNMWGFRESGFGTLANELFRKALTGWENLLDQDGKEIPFSDVVRDKIVRNTDTFNEIDVLKVFDLEMILDAPEDTKKKNSTSKKR